jgi:hypothetical protein
VGVEKVQFPPNSQNLGDTKCPENQESRLLRILAQFYFCEFRAKDFFNSHGMLRQQSQTVLMNLNLQREAVPVWVFE